MEKEFIIRYSRRTNINQRVDDEILEDVEWMKRVNSGWMDVIL